MPKAYRQQRAQCRRVEEDNASCLLVLLPVELWVSVLRLLPVRDAAALRRSCRFFAVSLRDYYLSTRPLPLAHVGSVSDRELWRPLSVWPWSSDDGGQRRLCDMIGPVGSRGQQGATGRHFDWDLRERLHGRCAQLRRARQGSVNNIFYEGHAHK